MIDWLAVILLVAFGLILVVVEVIFIPGTTIVGVLGAIFMGVGIYISFQNFGSGIGFIVLAVSAISSAATMYISFKSGVWKRFSLKETHLGRVNDEFKPLVEPGQTGTAVSTLRPFGKAEFDEKIYEVKSLGNYIKAGAKIKVIKIENHRILVEPLND